MGTTTPAAEVIQSWGQFATRLLNRWTAQANSLTGAADSTAQSTAVRDGLALGVTTAIDLAYTALGTVALLTEPTYTYADNAYETPSSSGVRTLSIPGNMEMTGDPTKTIPGTAMGFDPNPLDDKVKKFRVGCSTKDRSPGTYEGEVHVADANGDVVEKFFVTVPL